MRGCRGFTGLGVGGRGGACRREDRAFSAVEIAAAISLSASLLGVAVPTFVRDFKASRLVEPTEGLAAIGAGAVAYAVTHAGPKTVLLAFPRSVGLTPSTPARGRLAVDPPGTWSDPTWQALQFPTTGNGFSFADGDPHGFAFAFDNATSGAGLAARSTFVATAHGDLDGDGARSTFELHGHYTAADGPVVEPGMYIEDPLE